MFDSVYAGKKVLITGHTGFKGSWLTTWLLHLGAEVCGVAKDIPTIPAMFEQIGLRQKIQHSVVDIRDINAVSSVFHDFRPDFVFHLAAQAIVSESYDNPLDTISTNVLGTANILEVLREVDYQCAAVFVTSDKCYENVEWEWGYKETDLLGGKDIYSASKAGAEAVIHAYTHSFMDKNKCTIRVASARAGNVIGGGDWAPNRIVADIVRAWNSDSKVEIRCPGATRPWQHVLEPLSGYLTLGMGLYLDGKMHGQSFNFGPRGEQNHTVVELLQDLAKLWGFGCVEEAFSVTDNVPFHEAGLLKLNCDKALFHLKWQANLMYKECLELISEWYRAEMNNPDTLYQLTMRQIQEYQAIAKSRSLVWACK